MDLFALTRKLVDIESVTGNEAAVGEFLEAHLRSLDYVVRRIPVEADRFDLLALPQGSSEASIVLSTHMDVVPPWFPSSEDEQNIYGRGACDAKGIIAAQIDAAQKLRSEKLAIGLLFLVGEERNSLGAVVANREIDSYLPKRPQFLINGEPTENHVALASKGSLRVELTAHGRLAHSAYPELGESAIEKLLQALEKLRQMSLPENPEVGPCTMNIGMIEGGRAPNVIPDLAKAQLLYRLVGPSQELRQRISQAVTGLAEAQFVLDIPFMKLRAPAGLPTMVAAFTTDIPALGNWGEPVLLGPGTIHVAHTEREFVAKKDLLTSVELYCELARSLRA